MELWSYRGGRFIARYATLKALIRAAYGKQEQVLTTYQLEGGPKWSEEDRFDVEATAPGTADSTRGTFPPPVLAMLRNLLEDRFHLRAHFEQKELQVYALVLMRRDGALGPRLQRRTTDCTRNELSDLKTPILPGASTNQACGGRVVPGMMIATGATMANIVSGLARFVPNVSRVVVDRTGLTGTYNVDLNWAPDSNVAGDAAGVATNSNAPSFFTALEEQLGLKLQPAKEVVHVLQIDSVEHPTPD